MRIPRESSSPTKSPTKASAPGVAAAPRRGEREGTRGEERMRQTGPADSAQAAKRPRTGLLIVTTDKGLREIPAFEY